MDRGAPGGVQFPCHPGDRGALPALGPGGPRARGAPRRRPASRPARRAAAQPGHHGGRGAAGDGAKRAGTDMDPARHGALRRRALHRRAGADLRGGGRRRRGGARRRPRMDAADGARRRPSRGGGGRAGPRPAARPRASPRAGPDGALGGARGGRVARLLLSVGLRRRVAARRGARGHALGGDRGPRAACPRHARNVVGGARHPAAGASGWRPGSRSRWRREGHSSRCRPGPARDSSRRSGMRATPCRISWRSTKGSTSRSRWRWRRSRWRARRGEFTPDRHLTVRIATRFWTYSAALWGVGFPLVHLAPFLFAR